MRGNHCNNCVTSLEPVVVASDISLSSVFALHFISSTLKKSK